MKGNIIRLLDETSSIKFNPIKTAMHNPNRIKQLDLNLLKVFRSLYEEQNMSRTAEALHLTPSAISHAVRRLRDALGDPLFQRAQNRMVPTPSLSTFSATNNRKPCKFAARLTTMG